MSDKEIIAIVSILIGFVSYGIYLWGIYKNKIKPHFFTWTLFAILTTIVFFAQYSEKAGAGTWPTGVAAIVLFIISFVSFFKGEKHITKTDWLSFLISLAAIPLWLSLDNALYAVIIVSLIDALAVYPTFRKSWIKPFEESALSFSLVTLQFGLSLFALEVVNVTTILFPATIVVLNILLVAMILWRRRVLK